MRRRFGFRGRQYAPQFQSSSASFQSSSTSVPSREQRWSFDTWRAFITASRRPSDINGRRLSQDTGTGWLGCTSHEAHTWADQGWLAGAQSSRRFSDALITTVGEQMERLAVNYDVEGHTFDVARVIEGEPECWQRFDSEMSEAPSPRFLKIVVNIAQSGGVDARIAQRRGSLVTALVELLALAGIQTELTLVHRNQMQHGSTIYSRVTIKRFEDTLDLPVVAYALGHASVLRVHHFALRETLPASRRNEVFGDTDASSISGVPIDVPETERGDVYFPALRYDNEQWQTEEGAQRFLIDLLRKHGVTVNEAVR